MSIIAFRHKLALSSFSVQANDYIWPLALKSGSSESLKKKYDLGWAGKHDDNIQWIDNLFKRCSLRQLKWCLIGVNQSIILKLLLIATQQNQIKF